MKKKISIVVSAFLFLGLGATPVAADDRAFQYSGKDVSTPKGMPAAFDIKDVQVGINKDDEFEFFVVTKGGVRIANVSAPAEFTLHIDVNLDKVSDFTMTSLGAHSANVMSSRSLVKSDGGVVSDCDAYGWVSPDGDAYGWQVPKNCIYPQSTINFSVTATADGLVVDRYPDGSKWWNVKTNYFKAEPCASYLNGEKRSYLGTRYVCKKSGGSWKWLNWGKLAAAQSKYLTEKAFYTCNLGNKTGVLLEDSGRTLTLDGAFKYIITENDYDCVTRSMSVPASVLRKISVTRALDGTLEAKWGKINAFWNYHPDSGLNITFSYN